MFFNKTRIAAELRETELRLALLKGNSIIDAAVYEIPAESAFDRTKILSFAKTSIQKFHAATGKKAGEGVWILSGNEIESRFVTVPASDYDKAHQAIRWNAPEYLGSDLDGYVWDLEIVEEIDTGSRVLVTTIRKPEAEELAALFRSLNITPAGFCCIPLALYSVYRMIPSLHKCTAFVLLGSDMAHTIICDRNNLKFFRQSRCSLSDEASQIIAKIQHSFDYFQAEERTAVENIVIMGPEEKSRAITRNITSQKAKYENIRDYITMEHFTGDAADYVVLAGAGSDFGVIPLEKKKTAAASGINTIKTAAAILICIVLSYIWQKYQLNSLDREFEKLNVENSNREPLLKQYEIYSGLQSRLSRMESSVISILKNKTLWSSVIKEIADNTPQNLWITSLSETPAAARNYPAEKPGSVISISGHALSYNDVLEFKKNLEKSAGFERINLKNTSSSRVTDREVISFSIEFTAIKAVR